MNPIDRQNLRIRARRAIAAPVPVSVLAGGVEAGRTYWEDAAVLAAFVANGRGAEKARLALYRLDGRSSGAHGDGKRSAATGAPLALTPPSNTGVNKTGAPVSRFQTLPAAAQSMELFQ